MSYAETGQVNILVIDDDPDMLNFMAEVLIPEGYQVIGVSSAEKGLEQLPYQTFDIAFLDQKLPGMDGIVFGKYLLKNNPHMHIALVTGHSGPKLERMSREHHITYIEKPFKIEELLEVVDSYKAKIDAGQRHQKEVDATDYAPSFQPFFEHISDEYGLPEAPNRLQKLLFQHIRDLLGELSLSGRFTEEKRAMALSGLLAAQVFGMKLPRLKDGTTPWEAYDALMELHGKRKEFTQDEE
tara:strand:+ start:1866 stop:2585 length:720 start_codon:yes stop_codon:yes gene_type:complete